MPRNPKWFSHREQHQGGFEVQGTTASSRRHPSPIRPCGYDAATGLYAARLSCTARLRSAWIQPGLQPESRIRCPNAATDGRRRLWSADASANAGIQHASADDAAAGPASSMQVLSEHDEPERWHMSQLWGSPVS